jgi:hypothetical protein
MFLEEEFQVQSYTYSGLTTRIRSRSPISLAGLILSDFSPQRLPSCAISNKRSLGHYLRDASTNATAPAATRVMPTAGGSFSLCSV